MNRNEAITMVLTELEHAKMLHPVWPANRIHQAAIVMEEAGELIQATLEARYEPHKGGTPLKEAVQTAAMAIRFLMDAGSQVSHEIITKVFSFIERDREIYPAALDQITAATRIFRACGELEESRLTAAYRTAAMAIRFLEDNAP